MPGGEAAASWSRAKRSALSRLEEVGTRIGTTLAWLLLAIMLSLLGAALLVAALYLWLATLVSPALAATLSALAAFAAAGLIAVIGRALGRGGAKRHTAGPVAPPGLAAAALAGSEIGAAGSEWMRANSPKLVVAALAAGFVVGLSPRLRRALWRQLR